MGLLILFLCALAIIIAIGTLALIHHMQSPPRYTYATALARREPSDPRDLGLEAVDHTFRFDDGATSAGWIIKGAAPDGPTVILSHGLADSRYGSLLRVPLLVHFASRIVAYDLRGHGDSSAKKSTFSAKEPDDLLRVMNEVDDGSPFVLMGHSMGGGISIAVAARETAASNSPPSQGGVRGGSGSREVASSSAQSNVSSVGGSATLPQPLPGREWSQADTRHPAPDTRILAVIAEGGYRWPMETIANYLRQKGWPPYPFVWLAGLHFSFWLGITNANFDRVKHAAKLACPLLVVSGEADAISPLASARQVAAAAPNGRLVIIPGAGHGDLATTYKDRYLDALRLFFSTIQPREPQMNTDEHR